MKLLCFFPIAALNCIYSPSVWLLMDRLADSEPLPEAITSKIFESILVVTIYLFFITVPSKGNPKRIVFVLDWAQDKPQDKTAVRLFSIKVGSFYLTLSLLWPDE